MDKAVRVSLTNAIKYLQEKHYTNKLIGSKVGVTKLQVFYYSKGKTKKPSAKVCMAFYKELGILLDLYKDYQELVEHYKIENPGTDYVGVQ